MLEQNDLQVIREILKEELQTVKEEMKVGFEKDTSLSLKRFSSF